MIDYMFDEFTAIIPCGESLEFSLAHLSSAIEQLEPGSKCSRLPSPEGSARLAIDNVTIMLTSHKGQIPDEPAVSSIGMADLDEGDRQTLMTHTCFMIIECEPGVETRPMSRMVALIKTAIVLCDSGGWALCLPTCGVCVMAKDLIEIAELNAQGPRAWGVDEAEAALASYESMSLWDSLRQQGQPASLLAGFIPAEINGQTWFFSGGHSLFDLPELVYPEADIVDYETIRGYFRFLFSYLYNRPDHAKAKQCIKPDKTFAFYLDSLPPQYAELQSSTGTLLVRMVELSTPDNDWE